LELLTSPHPSTSPPEVATAIKIQDRSKKETLHKNPIFNKKTPLSIPSIYGVVYDKPELIGGPTDLSSANDKNLTIF
jgi:hypothetical protein